MLLLIFKYEKGRVSRKRAGEHPDKSAYIIIYVDHCSWSIIVHGDISSTRLTDSVKNTY